MTLELRDAFRGVRSTPLVTAVAVVSLALGIGGNTAIFSVLDAMLWRPLPVHRPSELVVVAEDDEPTAFWPQPVWSEIRDRGILKDAFAWTWTFFDTSNGGERQFVHGIAVSGGMFASLGLQPAIGRLLGERDEALDAAPDGRVAVISDRFWQRRFDRSPGAIGQPLLLDGRIFTIVGVTPRRFDGVLIGLPLDVIVPLGRSDDPRRAPYVTIMGRLAPGQTAAALTAALRGAQPAIRDATNPYSASPDRDEYLSERFVARPAAGGVSFLERRYARPFKTLLAIVGAVLLIACGNVAMLLVARARARRQELAVRVALGASRVRLAWQLIAESLLLAAGGVALGLVFARWCSAFVVAGLSSQAYTVFLDLAPDWRVLAFTSAVGVATAVLSGGLPALHAARTIAMDALTHRGDAGHALSGFGGAVVIVQVALSLLLVVGTGLLLRTFQSLTGVELGFDRDRILIVTILSRKSASPPAERARLYDRVTSAVAALPGVERAAMSLVMPAGNAAWVPSIELDEGTVLPQDIYANRVDPEWFATLGTRLIAGRAFDARDRRGAPAVVIVNEAFAQRFLKDPRPLGRTIVQRTAGDGPRRPLEIVGVVENAMYRTVKEAPPPTIYVPLAQLDEPPPVNITLSVRTETPSAAALVHAISGTIAVIDPALSLTFRTLSDQVGAQYALERLVARVAAIAGMFALLLAALGLYGTTAYGVARRRFEIGIRIAVGASPRQVLRLVLARVIGQVAAGVALGTLAALWAMPLIGTLLYGVPPRDAAIFAGASVLLVAVAGFAGWLPARRASRLDPAVVLRSGGDRG